MNEIQKSELGELSEVQIDQLAQAVIIPQKTPPAQVQIFAQICREKGISPFQKHVYLVGYGGKYSVITGIDGYRYMAGRTGLHAGTDEVLFDDNKTLDQCKQSGAKAPRTATCTVYKVVGGMRVPFTHSVAFSEFSGSGKWQSMPFQMLAKVAEAFALKKAFPENLSGLSVTEEAAAYNKGGVYQSQTEPTVEIDPEHSAKQFQVFTDTVEGYSDWRELQRESLGILNRAKAAGCSDKHVLELKKVIKNHFITLKSETNE